MLKQITVANKNNIIDYKRIKGLKIVSVQNIAPNANTMSCNLLHP